MSSSAVSTATGRSCRSRTPWRRTCSSQSVSMAIRSTVTMARRPDWSAPASTALSVPNTSAGSSSTPPSRARTTTPLRSSTWSCVCSSPIRGRGCGRRNVIAISQPGRCGASTGCSFQSLHSSALAAAGLWRTTRLQTTRSTAISSTLGMEATMTVRTERVDATDFYLQTTAVIFAAAVLVHGSDHVRRGLDASPTAVMIAGSIQAVVVLIAVVLVFRRTRWAPQAAIVAGFASAALFIYAHVLPTYAHVLPGFWTLSDSFVSEPHTHVSWFSSVTAVLETITPIVCRGGRGIGDSTRLIAALEARCPGPPRYPGDAPARPRRLAAEAHLPAPLRPALRAARVTRLFRDEADLPLRVLRGGMPDKA